MITGNFCFYLQNRLIQTSQTAGQWYSDTSPFSIPWLHRDGRMCVSQIVFDGKALTSPKEELNCTAKSTALSIPCLKSSHPLKTISWIFVHTRSGYEASLYKLEYCWIKWSFCSKYLFVSIFFSIWWAINVSVWTSVFFLFKTAAKSKKLSREAWACLVIKP